MVSTSGITRDLEAMRDVGIGRAYIGHIYDRREGDPSAVGDVKFNSPEWWQALQWAVKEADRCGIDIGFFNSPGWSQSGAPWIKPEESMRYLGHSEIVVSGGKTVDAQLPVPPIHTFPTYGGSDPQRGGPDFTAANFQDVRVVAYKIPEAESPTSFTLSGDVADIQNLSDGSDATVAGLAPNKPTTLTLEISSGNAVQNITVKPVQSSFTFTGIVEASDDGTSYTRIASHTEERGHQGPKNTDAIVIPFGETRARFLRVSLQFNRGLPPGETFKVAELSASNRALLAHYARKQLAETSPHIIIPTDAYTWPSQPAPAIGSTVQAAQVLDITDKMDATGRLRWDAPEGEWRVLRMGMIPIGTMNHPASEESRGLEIDKMSTTAVATLFNGMVGEFLRRTPAADRTALKYVIADSYETGPQNWTDGLIATFEKRYGYSPVRYLPVMTGQIVDSPEISNRFLWDLRNLICESVATEYVGGFRDIANKHGLKLWLENYGHWGFISEFLKFGSQADEVGGEIWESSDPNSNVECRAAASSAHIYGKTDVYAEAFTSGRTFKQSPASLKPWLDWTFGAGINHIILHVYIHQADERKPGIIQWFGTGFNRHNTWFAQSKSFLDYIRRGAVMLKAGKPVADVAYYIGEHSPSMSAPRDPGLPDGYDFDDVNSDVLVNAAKVVDGKIVLSDGLGYSVLVLPKDTQMRPEVAEAISNLVKAGAIVVGPKPGKSPSLQNFPQSDAMLKAIAEELWGNVDGSTVKSRQVGKGWIYDGVSLEEIFAKHGVQPDFVVSHQTKLRGGVAGSGRLGVNEHGGVLFKHRQTPDADIYFVSNTSTQSAVVDPSFRVSGKKPTLWNAVTSRVTEPSGWQEAAGRTTVPLELEPSESIYVVFAKGANTPGAGTAKSDQKTSSVLAALDSNWTVQFNGFGAPASIAFPTLTDWSKHSDPNIRHYSGTAIYKTTFQMDKETSGRVILDLGNVSIIATVSVNGKEVGTLWCNPWEIEIGEFLKPGENQLEIKVTNTWNNRLVGDSEKPEADRQTYVSQPYVIDKDNPLLSSGLLGPVQVRVEH
jgi:hypothetical protein